MKIGRWEGNEIIYTDDILNDSVNLMESFDFGTDILGANMVVSGMMVTEQTVPDMTVQISAGIAKDFTVGTFLIGEALNATITASDPVSDRKDVIEIRRVTEDITPSLRQFKDPITGNITASTIYTETEYKTEVKVLAGTPGAPASSVEAGWIKIAEVLVQAASTTVTNTFIYNVDADKSGVNNSSWSNDLAHIYRNGSISDMTTKAIDHIADNITSSNTVHGIQQGTGNSFDADKLDGNHKTEILAVTTVYNITTATDSTHNLPDATSTENLQITKRRGAGTGVVKFTTVSSQTIDTLAASELEIEREGSVVLIPKSGNWESIRVSSNLPKTYDLTSANVTKTLPEITGAMQTVSCYWDNGGTYKLTPAVTDGATVDGLAASIWTGEGKGHFLFESDGSNWQVREYEDSGTSSSIYWEKDVRGKLTQSGRSSAVASSSADITIVITVPKAVNNYAAARSSALLEAYITSPWFVYAGIMTSSTSLSIKFAERSGSARTATTAFNWELVERWRT